VIVVRYWKPFANRTRIDIRASPNFTGTAALDVALRTREKITRVLL